MNCVNLLLGMLLSTILMYDLQDLLFIGSFTIKIILAALLLFGIVKALIYYSESKRNDG